MRLRKELAQSGLDPGPDTIAWHLQHHHNVKISVATVSRTLTRQGLVTPEPKKRPKASYISGSKQPCPTRPGSPTSGSAPTSDAAIRAPTGAPRLKLDAKSVCRERYGINSVSPLEERWTLRPDSGTPPCWA